MEKYYTFHRTERGHLHILKEIPCEDYSGSYADEQGKFYIAAVADGHGDSSCMRSEKGSRLAVEAAMDCLKEYACRQEKPDIRILAKQIVDYWGRLVENDLTTPFSEEELKKAGLFEEIYRNGERLKHAYGTTLIAALMLPDSLILIQQGDGRCDVFYEDGSVDQPVPWDEKCHENVTTSMCDNDAAEHIRSQVLDLREKKVIACYLGSDGIEDSYRNMEGTHMFYRELTCRLNDLTPEEFSGYLKEMLPPFSRQGSGDDVSVSGIVDLERIKPHVAAYRTEIRKYNLEEELTRYENRKISMSRKHGILKKRADEAKKAWEDSQQCIAAGNESYRNSKSILMSVSEKIQRVQQQRRIHNEQMKESHPFVRNTLRTHMTELDQQFQVLCTQKESLEKNISVQKDKLLTLRTNEEDRKAKYLTAKKNFQEYDDTYRQIQAAIDRIQREIAELSHGADPHAQSPAAPETTLETARIPAEALDTPLVHIDTQTAISDKPKTPSGDSDLKKLNLIWQSLPDFSPPKK